MLGFPYAIPRWENLSPDDMTFSMDIIALVLEWIAVAEMTPGDVHMLWLNKRRNQGYKLGNKRDRANKVHPNMMPYELLPKREQMKAKIVLETIRLFGNIEDQQQQRGDVVHG
jgi:hypothetical protein